MKINVFAPKDWGLSQKKAMIEKVIKKTSIHPNTIANAINNITVEYNKINNKKYNYKVTVTCKIITKYTFYFELEELDLW